MSTACNARLQTEAMLALRTAKHGVASNIGLSLGPAFAAGANTFSGCILKFTTSDQSDGMREYLTFFHRRLAEFAASKASFAISPADAVFAASQNPAQTR